MTSLLTRTKRGQVRGKQHLLLAAYYLLLTTTHYSLLTTHCSLLTAHYSPLTTHYHKVSVNLDGEPIAGSPFTTVVVHPHPPKAFKWLAPRVSGTAPEKFAHGACVTFEQSLLTFGGVDGGVYSNDLRLLNTRSQMKCHTHTYTYTYTYTYTHRHTHMHTNTHTPTHAGPATRWPH